MVFRSHISGRNRFAAVLLGVGIAIAAVGSPAASATSLDAPAGTITSAKTAATSTAPTAPVVSAAEYQRVTANVVDLPGESDTAPQAARSTQSQAAAAALVNLPYDSTYSVQYTLNSGKRWQTSTGKACVYMRSDTNWSGQNVTASIASDGNVDYAGPYNFPQDGQTRGICFTGLSTSWIWHVKLVHTTNSSYPMTGAITVTKG